MASAVAVVLVVRATSTSTTCPRRRCGRIVVATVTVVACPRSSTTSRATLPRFDRSVCSGRVVGTATIAILDRATRLSTTHLGHESIKLVLGRVADATLVAVVAAVVAPWLTDLALGTIASHMSSLTTDTTNDTSREVLLLRTVVLAVTNLTTVLAGLVLVVSKGTVESGELTKLVALEFVLAFGN